MRVGEQFVTLFSPDTNLSLSVRIILDARKPTGTGFHGRGLFFPGTVDLEEGGSKNGLVN